jgi:hypothetical protein
MTNESESSTKRRGKKSGVWGEQKKEKYTPA